MNVVKLNSLLTKPLWKKTHTLPIFELSNLEKFSPKLLTNPLKLPQNSFFSSFQVIFQLNLLKPVGYCIVDSKLIKKREKIIKLINELLFVWEWDCLRVFDHFVGLPLKVLRSILFRNFLTIEISDFWDITLICVCGWVGGGVILPPSPPLVFL